VLSEEQEEARGPGVGVEQEGHQSNFGFDQARRAFNSSKTGFWNKKKIVD